MPIVDRFNVDGQDYSIEPVLDAVPIQNSQHAVMSGGVFADKSNVPVQGSTKNFTAAGAYDFFFNSTTKMEWAAKVLGSQLGQGWARTIVGDPNPQETPPSLSFGAFAYGNGVWVAGATDSCYEGAYYSLDDGVTWQKSDMYSYGSWGLAFGDGKFVLAAGKAKGLSEQGGLWYSTDGQHWTQSNVTQTAMRDVKYCNGTWIATAAYISGQSNGGIYYSSDGENWTLSQNTSGITFTRSCPNEDGSVWIVGSSQQGLWRSDDGGETFVNVISVGYVQAIIYGYIFGQGVWVCLSWYNNIAQSPSVSDDGIHWTSLGGAPTFTNTTFYDGLYSKKDDLWLGACVGAGSGTIPNKGILYSEDGYNFYFADAPATTTTGYYSVCYANGVYLAGCNDSANTNSGLYRSTDGKHWTKVLDTKTTTGLFYANGTWVHNGSDPVSRPTEIIKRSSVDMLMESLT